MKWLRKLYNWELSWADTPYGEPVLFLNAFAESSFFPVPPDALLIALALSKPKRSFRYASVSSIGSVLGGAFGYLIGLLLLDSVGMPILKAYGLMDKYNYVSALYNQYNALAVGLAGFTPLPYKLFTIAAGACKINFLVFIIASFVSRSARFFFVSALLYFFGEKARDFIDKYFNWLALAFGILLVGGFIVLKFAVK